MVVGEEDVVDLVEEEVCYGIHFVRGDKVQDKSEFPDWALIHFAYKIKFIIAVICY